MKKGGGGLFMGSLIGMFGPPMGGAKGNVIGWLRGSGNVPGGGGYIRPGWKNQGEHYIKKISSKAPTSRPHFQLQGPHGPCFSPEKKHAYTECR